MSNRHSPASGRSRSEIRVCLFVQLVGAAPLLLGARRSETGYLQVQQGLHMVRGYLSLERRFANPAVRTGCLESAERYYNVTMQKTMRISRVETSCISISPTETFVWFLLGIIVIAGRLIITGSPEMLNDSYQYLSVANNILKGNGVQTSIVHFDTERSWQHIPAPMTTFPSGYPFVIAALSALGIKAENAALLTSAIGLPFLLILYQYLAKPLALSRTSLRFLFLWTVANSWATVYSSSILSESLFTSTSFASIAFFLIATVPKGQSGYQLNLLILANILLGASYWIRYAGLFLFVATLLFFALQLSIQRDRKSLLALASMTISASIIAIGLVRNALLVGTWKGGNNKEVFHPIFERIHDFVVSVHHLFLGGLAASRFGIMELILLLGALFILWLIIWVMLKRDSRFFARELSKPIWFLIIYVVVYCCAMIYLGVTSVISFDSRMFYPLLPSVLFLVAIFITALEKNLVSELAHKAALASALLAMSAGYVIINSRSYMQQSSPAPHEIVKRYLAGKTSDNVALSTWIERNIPREATIVADSGQATAYVLGRKTVSLVSSTFSNQVWNEENIMVDMKIYDAEYLIVYAADHRSSAGPSQNPFLRNLAQGYPPRWLTIAARNDETIVYRAHIDNN